MGNGWINACGEKIIEDTGDATQDTGVQQDTSTESNEFVPDATLCRFSMLMVNQAFLFWASVSPSFDQ